MKMQDWKCRMKHHESHRQQHLRQLLLQPQHDLKSLVKSLVVEGFPSNTEYNLQNKRSPPLIVTITTTNVTSSPREQLDSSSVQPQMQESKGSYTFEGNSKEISRDLFIINFSHNELEMMIHKWRGNCWLISQNDEKERHHHHYWTAVVVHSESERLQDETANIFENKGSRWVKFLWFRDRLCNCIKQQDCKGKSLWTTRIMGGSSCLRHLKGRSFILLWW